MLFVSMRSKLKYSPAVCSSYSPHMKYYAIIVGSKQRASSLGSCRTYEKVMHFCNLDYCRHRAIIFEGKRKVISVKNLLSYELMIIIVR